MSSDGPYRICLTEHHTAFGAVAKAADALGISHGEVAALLRRCNERLAQQLGLEYGPLTMAGSGLRAEDIAGLVRVAPQLEIEIAPKFLGEKWKNWREDFFVIAAMSRFGRLFASDRMLAGFGERGDLVTVVARALVDEYWRNQRRPLRSYRRSTTTDFAIEGDVEAEDLVMFDSDGYKQEVVTLTRMNQYNAAISEAAADLMDEVSDLETRDQLRRVRTAIGPQARNRRRLPRTVPNRHRNWQNLYDLARQVSAGFGIDFSESSQHVTAPGYVLKTPSAWEDVLTSALRLGFPNLEVKPKVAFTLGERDGEPVEVRPDIVVYRNGAPLLIDAKYKTRVEKARPRISASDVYEGLAFMRAACTDKLMLIYPALAANQQPAPAGTTIRFETVTVDGMKIEAFQTECRGLAVADGFKTFSRNLADAVSRF